jgi:hypothetical protein
MGGLGFATIAGWKLLWERFPRLAYSPGMIVLFLTLFALFLIGALQSRKVSPQSSVGWSICWAAGFGVLGATEEHVWSIVILGALSAFVFAKIIRSRYDSPVLMFGGFIAWNLAVVAALHMPWPNAQRFSLVLLLGGVVNATQALFALRSEMESSRVHSGVAAQ